MARPSWMQAERSPQWLQHLEGCGDEAGEEDQEGRAAGGTEDDSENGQRHGDSTAVQDHGVVGCVFTGLRCRWACWYCTGLQCYDAGRLLLLLGRAVLRCRWVCCYYAGLQCCYAGGCAAMQMGLLLLYGLAVLLWSRRAAGPFDLEAVTRLVPTAEDLELSSGMPRRPVDAVSVASWWRPWEIELSTAIVEQVVLQTSAQKGFPEHLRRSCCRYRKQTPPHWARGGCCAVRVPLRRARLQQQGGLWETGRRCCR